MWEVEKWIHTLEWETNKIGKLMFLQRREYYQLEPQLISIYQVTFWNKTEQLTNRQIIIINLINLTNLKGF